MFTSEAKLASEVRKTLKRAGFKYQRIENSADMGTPDVDYLTPAGNLGKLELKLPLLTVRPETPIRLNLSKEQRAYVNTWGRRGPVYVLACVGRECLLLGAPVIDYPLDDLRRMALWHDSSLAGLPSTLMALSERV